MSVGIELRLDISGMLDKLKAVKERLRDLAPVLEPRAEAFITMTKVEVFGGEQSPVGERWAPLAESTVDAKRQGSTRILIDTGELQNAIHAEATSSGIRVGVSGAPATYGVHHQFGTGRMPRRAFLPLDEGGILDMTAGPAKTWRDRTAERLHTYVTTGEV